MSEQVYLTEPMTRSMMDELWVIAHSVGVPNMGEPRKQNWLDKATGRILWPFPTLISTKENKAGWIVGGNARLSPGGVQASWAQFIALLVNPNLKLALPKELKLNDEYSAVVDGDNVKVGCQTIPISKIDELYKLIHS